MKRQGPARQRSATTKGEGTHESAVEAIIVAFDHVGPGGRLSTGALQSATGLAASSPAYRRAAQSLRTNGAADGRRLTYSIGLGRDGMGLYALTRCPQLHLMATVTVMLGIAGRAQGVASAAAGLGHPVEGQMRRALLAITRALVQVQTVPVSGHPRCEDCPSGGSQ